VARVFLAGHDLAVARAPDPVERADARARVAEPDTLGVLGARVAGLDAARDAGLEVGQAVAAAEQQASVLAARVLARSDVVDEPVAVVVDAVAHLGALHDEREVDAALAALGGDVRRTRRRARRNEDRHALRAALRHQRADAGDR